MTMTFQVIHKIVSVIILSVFGRYFRTWNTDPYGFYGPNISNKYFFHYFHEETLINNKNSLIYFDADAAPGRYAAKWIDNLAHEHG